MSTVAMNDPSVYPDAAPMPPDAKAQREAAEVVQKRVQFVGQLIVWFMCMLFLGVATESFGTPLVVGLLWGIWLAKRGHEHVLTPILERRWYEDELRWRTSREREADAPAKSTRSLEELSASIAHEIRNPITAAKSLVQQMGEDPGAAENAEYAKVALEELARVERSIAHLLRYARDEAFTPSETTLIEVIDASLEVLKDRLDRAKVTIQREHDGPGALTADAEKLRRIVLNVLTNALDALEDGPTPAPKITISSGTNLAGTELWLKIRDNGPGIPKERIDEVTKPFHTSKPHGTGLGLSITKKLVELHRGQLEIKSEPGLYAEITVTLPRGGQS